MINKPELLLPAGNVESFYAALQGGADAVYLGLKHFNARGRANNFTELQFLSILKEAKNRKVLVYVTLNTVIKNSELELLLEYLHFLNEVGADGIIVQDWGVFYIARKFFPNLKIHASTQMGIHNSLGTSFSYEKGFRRVVLARELTLKELETIATNSIVETEVFVHGALCYSFSGMCLFSSYVGGRGANRGICAQPCRRDYNDNNKKKYLFNLKDNQLLDYVPQLAKMGVNSLKVEGRLKSGEYTFRVGSAYRMALDDAKQNKIANEKLTLDFGRQKTTYFVGNDLKNAISDETSTGIFLGKVEKVFAHKIHISSSIKIEPKFRLRILADDNSNPIYIIVKNPVQEGSFYAIDNDNRMIEKNSRVYLTKLQDRKFPDKLETIKQIPFNPISRDRKRSILNGLNGNQPKKTEELYFRINSLEWLSRINFNELDGVFLLFSKITWTRFNFEDSFIKNNSDKIYIELPKFIAEDSIEFYAGLVNKMVLLGIRNFVISHLSQKLLIPEYCRIVTNENVYLFNDAAIKLMVDESVETFVYPFETDFETLESLTNKSGIVPIYFYPELFFSRMPVQLENSEAFVSDDLKTKFKRFRKNGITIVVPERPVSILHHKNRLSKVGFYRYLVDVSYDSFSKNRLKTLKTRFLKSEQIQPSTTFNFLKGMK